MESLILKTTFVCVFLLRLRRDGGRDLSAAKLGCSLLTSPRSCWPRMRIWPHRKTRAAHEPVSLYTTYSLDHIWKCFFILPTQWLWKFPGIQVMIEKNGIYFGACFSYYWRHIGLLKWRFFQQTSRWWSWNMTVMIHIIKQATPTVICEACDVTECNEVKCGQISTSSQQLMKSLR